MGLPGTLPVPNKEAIFKALCASLAIGCTIQEKSNFDRKHYFYPDLPKGFQISQYDSPLAKGGSVIFDIVDSSGNIVDTHTCGITRLHIEDDAGKLTHRGHTTLCDFNRAGTPLMEIVTEPDLRSASDAVAFTQELRRTLIAVHASQADMFKGMMRFDASISLRKKGSKILNPRSEIKNLNSFKSLERALLYEEQRLRECWKKDGCPLKKNITVGWIDDKGITKILREKEEAADYRYFPEPDIYPLYFTKADIENLLIHLPTLPRALKDHYQKIGLDEKQSLQLVDQPALREIFDIVHQKTSDPRRASSIVLNQLLGFLNAKEKNISQGPGADEIIELISKIDDATISSNTGKDVLEEMVNTGKNASTIIQEKGLIQITNDKEITSLVQKAIAANPDMVASYKTGKEAALGAIVGWVMKESKGQADPRKVNEILKSFLMLLFLCMPLSPYSLLHYLPH
jgi:aspartyl-tRNA(Asn)/glutamyl-tRNA(Gln) amidotransferase subunit B